MGDQITNMISGALPKGEAPQIDVMGIITNEIFKIIPPGVLEFYNTNMLLCQLGLICVFMLLALQGYKLFKMGLYAGSAFVFGYVGLKHLAPLVAGYIAPHIPAELGIKVDALIAIVCALIAVFLTRCAYNFMILALGGLAGYFLGSSVIYGALVEHFHTLDFLTQFTAVKHIVGGILAGVLGILFILLFKHLFMVITSFGCSIGAAMLLQMLVMPAAGNPIKIAFAILGFALGIYAIVRQYREEEKDTEIVF